jgi:hypothetical protein
VIGNAEMIPFRVVGSWLLVVRLGASSTRNEQRCRADLPGRLPLAQYVENDVGSPATNNQQPITKRASDVLLPLDRAAVVPGLGHHPVDRPETQHAGERDGGRPAHRNQQPIKGRLANVAEAEEEVPHLEDGLSGREYRSGGQRLSVGPEVAWLSVVRCGGGVRSTMSSKCSEQRRQPDNRQPTTDNSIPCW